MNDHPCKYEADIREMKNHCELIPQIHQALVGGLNGTPGLITRTERLEDWRKTTTTRVKNRLAWIWGLFGSIIGGGCLILAKKFL